MGARHLRSRTLSQKPAGDRKRATVPARGCAKESCGDLGGGVLSRDTAGRGLILPITRCRGDAMRAHPGVSRRRPGGTPAPTRRHGSVSDAPGTDRHGLSLTSGRKTDILVGMDGLVGADRVAEYARNPDPRPGAERGGAARLHPTRLSATSGGHDLTPRPRAGGPA